MKVLHLSFSKKGGAGVSAFRLSEALQKIGIESEFIYFKPYAKETARIGWLEKKLNGLRNILFSQVFHLGTINLFPSSLLRVINESDADLIHLHWINAEMLSIEQIAKIKKPLVWTFHDMWPICGTDPIVYDERYKGSRGQGLGGTRGWVWRRKKKCWGHLDVHIICPSSWLAGCVRQSDIFTSSPVSIIPNGMDLSIFSPSDRMAARDKYQIGSDDKVILFGAYDPHNFNKGGDLLRCALELLSLDHVRVVVFGAVGTESIAGFPTTWMGFIESPQELAQLYATADVVCVPSRIETFGQTASEPQACGVPVVAFDTTGLKDVVKHKVTGYLATPFDVQDFARGIEWVLAQDAGVLGTVARSLAEERFSEELMAQRVLKIYDGVLYGKSLDVNGL